MPEQVPDLDEWEKLRREEKFELTSLIPKTGVEQKLSQIDIRTTEMLPKQFREGADYKGEI